MKSDCWTSVQGEGQGNTNKTHTHTNTHTLREWAGLDFGLCPEESRDSIGMDQLSLLVRPLSAASIFC